MKFDNFSISVEIIKYSNRETRFFHELSDLKISQLLTQLRENTRRRPITSDGNKH